MERGCAGETDPAKTRPIQLIPKDAQNTRKHSYIDTQLTYIHGFEAIFTKKEKRRKEKKRKEKKSSIYLIKNTVKIAIF